MMFSASGVLATVLALSPAALAAFDQNRGGAVLKAPAGASFASATGTFTVPSLTGTSKLSIWVAIGDTLEQDVVLKGGVTYTGSGLTTFAAWAPGAETALTGQVPVRGGDTVTVTVARSATDPGAGTVTVENTTQNRRAAQAVAVPAAVADPAELPAGAADWFVQAYQDAGELVRVPRFGTVTFTRAGATLANGTAVGLTGAGTFEIQGTSGQIYSRTTVTANTVTVRQQ
ncbi:concanavalin A-like lectin/glucanase [Durotheca rogersii]|uniref:concanavalin A-like lectin/glucanase n=1 Tax=Durotheca rogersii TaxID=419775 RepID=UPI00221F1166|nr:concanavalin A-like lectin/glucanase [Durotheca rogersii]KAI5868231.1 concanavalin A-like lectin/glucanase [Durotheca rogersii]